MRQYSLVLFWSLILVGGVVIMARHELYEVGEGAWGLKLMALGG